MHAGDYNSKGKPKEIDETQIRKRVAELKLLVEKYEPLVETRIRGHDRTQMSVIGFAPNIQLEAPAPRARTALPSPSFAIAKASQRKAGVQLGRWRNKDIET